MKFDKKLVLRVLAAVLVAFGLYKAVPLGIDYLTPASNALGVDGEGEGEAATPTSATTAIPTPVTTTGVGTAGTGVVGTVGTGTVGETTAPIVVTH